MFCIYLQLDGFRQVERISPATTDNLVASLDQILSRSGATLFKRDAGLFLYLFLRSREADHRQALATAFAVRDELERTGDELNGFTVVIEYLGAGDAVDVFRRLRQAASRFLEDRSIWIGPAAADSLAADVAVSRHDEYLRVDSSVPIEARRLVDCADFMRNDQAAAETLDRIESWINGEAPPGIVVFACSDRSYARENARHLLRDLFGSQTGERWVSLYHSRREDEALAAIANSVVTDLVPLVESSLAEHEQRLWRVVAAVIPHIACSPALFGYFDDIEADVVAAYTLYLTAVFRMLQRDLLPPAILLEDVDQFPEETLRLLREVYDRVESDFAPIIVATSAQSQLPGALADLPTVYTELSLFSAADVTRHADRFLSEAAQRHIRIADCCRRTQGLPLELYFHFVNVQDSLEHPASTRIAVQHQTGHSEAGAVLRRLHQDEREMLTLAALISGHSAGSLLGDIAVRLGYDRLRIQQMVRRLVGLGLMRDVDSMYVAIQHVREAALSSLGTEGTRVAAAAADALLTTVAEGDARLTPSLVGLVAGSGDAGMLAVRDFLRHALDSRRFDRVSGIAAQPALFGAERAEIMSRMIYTVELRRALLLGNESRADRLYNGAAPSPARIDSTLVRAVEGDTCLEHARYVHAKGNLSQASILCKRAIMLYQDAGDDGGMARANLEFGALLLAQENLSDARDYFVMARPQTSAGRDGYDTFMARIAELVCLFLSGRLTRVAEQIDPLRERAGELGLRQADLFLQLLFGRVKFELGYYEQALAVLQQALCDAEIYRKGDASRVLRAWCARCLIYLGDTSAALAALAQLSDNEEVRFFRAEALQRRGQPDEALAELGIDDTLGERQLDQAGKRRAFRSPEQIDWESGFAPIEDRALGLAGGERVLVHLSKSFRAYLLALIGEPDQGIVEFHRMTRQQKVSKIDPYNRLYYFLYSEVLPRSKNPDREDPLTILGKSVKYMQERSSCIDEYRDKLSFLSGNYWNKLLLDSARSHNLL